MRTTQNTHHTRSGHLPRRLAVFDSTLHIIILPTYVTPVVVFPVSKRRGIDAVDTETLEDPTCPVWGMKHLAHNPLYLFLESCLDGALASRASMAEPRPVDPWHLRFGWCLGRGTRERRIRHKTEFTAHVLQGRVDGHLVYSIADRPAGGFLQRGQIGEEHLRWKSSSQPSAGVFFRHGQCLLLHQVLSHRKSRASLSARSRSSLPIMFPRAAES